ncbi:DHHC zinc finger domain-containing protein [Phlyctema vagabunda]|uniref:Palmitoyltransferase PFA4 n=1 Tax=Phlyctema vagabunda TaxID=108571 RepID=A0ABR4PJG0_9HELO
MALLPQSIQALAVPAVCILIAFLAYTSQILFYHLEPGPLSRKEAIWFNGLVFCLWWCYAEAVRVDPGPKGWVERFAEDVDANEDGETLKKGVRWCKKCEAVKPPRAHHCRACGRCIPKMDHHCPWTQNCVSHTTFPHFIRFVLYCVISTSLLAYHLFLRLKGVWMDRNLPAYLGPPTWAMAHLFVLTVLNGLILFALSILLVRAIYSLGINTTMIESWEIERHEALVYRAKKNGGWTYGSGGQRLHIRHQEFPYDIGIWQNLVQAMGTGNVISWILPFAGGPDVSTAGKWEENGFEDAGTVWPPLDPDKMPRAERNEAAQVYQNERDAVAAFRERQAKDYERFAEVDSEPGGGSEEAYDSEYEAGIDGEPGWTNSDGDRLRDYGVDEEAELIAEDDIPLGELLRRRRARAFA